MHAQGVTCEYGKSPRSKFVAMPDKEFVFVPSHKICFCKQTFRGTIYTQAQSLHCSEQMQTQKLIVILLAVISPLTLPWNISKKIL